MDGLNLDWGGPRRLMEVTCSEMGRRGDMNRGQGGNEHRSREEQSICRQEVMPAGDGWNEYKWFRYEAKDLGLDPVGGWIGCGQQQWQHPSTTVDDSYRALLILGSLTLDPVTFYHTSSPFQVPRVLGEPKKNADTADALCKIDLNRIPRNRRNLLCHGRCFVHWPHRLQLHWSLAPLPPQARDILKHLQSPS